MEVRSSDAYDSLTAISNSLGKMDIYSVVMVENAFDTRCAHSLRVFLVFSSRPLCPSAQYIIEKTTSYVYCSLAPVKCFV